MTTIRLRRDQILRLLDGFPVQVATSVGLLDVVGVADDPWQPLHQIPVTRAITTHHRATGQPPPDELWHNETYEVFVYRVPSGPDSEVDDDAIHLSIKRYDRAAVRNWRHFQQMKNEIVGPEVEAIEIFPRESRLADNANQYHLWCLPEGMDIPFGWEGGMVLVRDDEVDAYNKAPHGGRQEPRQSGLTVGDTMDDARSPELDEQVQQFLNPQGGPA